MINYEGFMHCFCDVFSEVHTRAVDPDEPNYSRYRELIESLIWFEREVETSQQSKETLEKDLKRLQLDHKYSEEDAEYWREAYDNEVAFHYKNDQYDKYARSEQKKTTKKKAKK